ncbi:retrotransposable element ORF2 protein [Plecturocebus cupreus]
MEYYAAIKNYEFVSFVGTWMNLETIILSKLTQEHKIKHRMFSLIVSLCHPDWSAVAQSQLTAVLISQAQMILPPKTPKYLETQIHSTHAASFIFCRGRMSVCCQGSNSWAQNQGFHYIAQAEVQRLFIGVIVVHCSFELLVLGHYALLTISAIPADQATLAAPLTLLVIMDLPLSPNLECSGTTTAHFSLDLLAQVILPPQPPTQRRPQAGCCSSPRCSPSGSIRIMCLPFKGLCDILKSPVTGLRDFEDDKDPQGNEEAGEDNKNIDS